MFAWFRFLFQLPLTLYYSVLFRVEVMQYFLRAAEMVPGSGSAEQPEYLNPFDEEQEKDENLYENWDGRVPS